MGLFLCLISFAGTLVAGCFSLGAGMGAVLTVGYFYGIVRANYPDSFTHFLFDAAVLGLYLAQLPRSQPQLVRLQTRAVVTWLIVLIGWPVVFFLIPQQHPLIQLVGLRAAIFFLPFILLGARAREADLNQLSFWLACLNVIVFGFAVAEYVLGLERFFPRNSVTELIWRSTLNISTISPMYRIPATFPNSAGYGGVMVATLPFLFNQCLARDTALPARALYATAIVASALGLFMCGSRSPIILLFMEVAVLLFYFKASLRIMIVSVLFGAIVAYFVFGSERMQRFTTLADTEAVINRVHGSMNMTFFEVLATYPLGRGLGSAGTSIPFFLKDLVQESIVLENEYARIALEQSLLGLFLWLGFIIWVLAHRRGAVSQQWRLGMAMMYGLIAISWGTAFLGFGMTTAIPGTSILFFQMGLLAKTPAPEYFGSTRTAGSRALSRARNGSHLIRPTRPEPIREQ